MADRDPLIKHIDSLRTELLNEFRDRRQHVDSELRRLHEKLDHRTAERDAEIKAIYETMSTRDKALREELQPLLMARAGRRMLRHALIGAITLLATVGGVVIGAVHLALRWWGGG